MYGMEEMKGKLRKVMNDRWKQHILPYIKKGEKGPFA